MIVTIEEAKTKWCPYVQVSASATNKLNNVALIYSNRASECKAKCIADECMAWRQVKYAEDNGTFYPCNDKGYCGFVGKPEGVK